MADVAARREARRRKILENSQNRLQLISGKQNSDCLQDVSLKINNSVSSGTPVSVDSCSSSSRGTVCNGALVTEPEPLGEVESLSSLLTGRNIDAAGDGELVDDIAAFLATPQEQPRKKILLEKLSQHKYDVVLLSLFMHLLQSYSVLIMPCKLSIRRKGTTIANEMRRAVYAPLQRWLVSERQQSNAK